MAFSIGITGLPNVGKSTLFKALTKKQVAVAPFPFTTIEPNLARVPVPDLRLEKISQIIRPEKTTAASVEFIDVAGLVKGAHLGQGLGNQFLSHIQGCQALLEVVRAFEAEDIEHPEKTIDPQRDIEIIEKEFLMKDLKVLQTNLAKFEKKVKTGDKEEKAILMLLKKVKENLEIERPISELALIKEEKKLLQQFQFLTAKPVIYLFNVREAEKKAKKNLLTPEVNREKTIVLDLKLEEELTELSETDRKEISIRSLLDQVILKCYAVLGLITFYTVAGGKEVRAWPVSKASPAKTAAGLVHSDFEEKFIKAEVLSFKELVTAKSWTKAKEQGLVRTVGKDYIVQDGDVIEFKI